MNDAILKFRRYEDASLGWTAPCPLRRCWGQTKWLLMVFTVNEGFKVEIYELEKPVSETIKAIYADCEKKCRKMTKF